MKTFYIVACLLMLALSLQVVYAQQPSVTEPTEESAEGFVKLEMPLEEALTLKFGQKANALVLG